MDAAADVDDDRDLLVAEWLRARALYLEARERMNTCAGQLAELLPVGVRHTIGPGQTVKLFPPSQRFDPRKAVEVLTPEQLAEVCVTVPDAGRARQLLPPAVFRACTAPSGTPYVKEVPA